MKKFFICEVTFHIHLFTMTVIGHLCWLLWSPLLRLCRPRDSFRHSLSPTRHIGNSPRWWGGCLLTEALWCWGPSSLCTVYSSPEWLWRSHKAVITGVVEIFPYISWEDFFIFIFIIYASMFYFWKITYSSLKKNPTLVNSSMYNNIHWWIYYYS